AAGQRRGRSGQRRAAAARPGRGGNPAQRGTTATEAITPRTTRPWRTPDLRAFQRAIIDLLPADPFEAAECAVVVPSRGAAEQLRRTLEDLALADGAAR